MLTRFLRNRRGSVLPTFAIALIPLLVSTGAVIDYTNAFDEKTMVQDAMDSAALAAGKQIGIMTTDEVKIEAGNFFDSNIDGKVTQTPTLVTAISGATIDLTTTLHVKTYFLGLIGLDEFIFDLKAQATLAMGTLEVALVLDNSGSMSGSKISTLRTAATDLTNTLFGLGTTSTKPDPVKVSLIPFAGAVNVGSSNKTSGWMDTTAVSPYHGETFEGYSGSPPVSNNSPAAINLFTLFDSMNGAGNAWAGCVEERPAPYDVQDDEATTATPATMFVPMFAPDEPDNWTCTDLACPSPTYRTGSGSNRRYNRALTGARDHNNYLPDFPTGAGKCSGTNANWTCKNGTCGGGSGVTEQTALARTCKYGTPANKVTPVALTVSLSGGGSSYPGGPNFMCTTGALTPLSTNQSDITTKISAMQANGITNITAGLMWGWRTLSPTAPFTEGRANDVADNQKIIILMTDGENTYFANGKFTKSHYGAWGYVWKQHLGTNSSDEDDMEDKEDERLAAACDNANTAGTKIYTVAFQISDPDTLQLLTDCATEPDMAYQSSSNSALLAAFTAIGDDISLLRVSQ